MQKFSFRAQEMLNNPKHFINEEGPSIDEFHWSFFLQESATAPIRDKILTLHYKYKLVNEYDLLFLEALSRLGEGQTIEAINRLSFRETENFLRDENHQSTFLEESENLAQMSFKRVKNSLLEAFVKKKMQEKLPLDQAKLWNFSNWNDLIFVEKNRKVLAFLSQLNTLFPNEGSLQLLLVEGQEITIKLNDFPLSLEVVELLMNNFFLKTEKKTSLKVVAAL